MEIEEQMVVEERLGILSSTWGDQPVVLFVLFESVGKDITTHYSQRVNAATISRVIVLLK